MAERDPNELASNNQNLNNPKPRKLINGKPVFHKVNTIDNLYNVFYGFQSGQLLVEVLEARDIKKYNDIFCEIQIDKMKMKTQLTGGELPHWGEEFAFDVKEINSEVKITLLKSKRLLPKHSGVGYLSIPIKQFQDGNIHEGWYPMTSLKSKDSGKTIGELYLRLQFTTAIERNKDYLIASDHRDKLMSLLLHHDIVILATLSRVYDSEELSKTVIRIFNSEGQALRLLIQLIYRDLKLTAAEETLFRNDSMATKTTRNYFKLIAPDYLHNTLHRAVEEIIANPRGLELDPVRLTEQDNPVENATRLSNAAQKVLDTIVASVDTIPLNMRKFFNLLRQLVRQCFPNSELKSIGCFIWLRFLVPAIISPSAFGVIDEDITDLEVKRALTMIGKVLQNLANGVSHFKEPYMQPIDSFLMSNVEKINEFYEHISMIPADGPKDAWRRKFTEEDKLKCLSLIVGQLSRNLDRVEKKLNEDPRMRDSEAQAQNQVNFAVLKDILKSKDSVVLPKEKFKS